ncbi:hypothetical protein SEPCBS119000_000675 [Sporothrix epigloea]|uniref:Uncharacterized protein n=1 Tax=Sporothrix epigloea TaxID=1892477 RepID=A0ABP0D8Z3_9PEZI
MPSTDCLQPPLTADEKKIVKAYGGWTNTMISFGLKPFYPEDVEEAKMIVSAFARDEKREAKKRARQSKQ